MRAAIRRVTGQPRTNRRLILMASQLTIPERFWSKVEFTESCWLWRDSHRHLGYGVFWIWKKKRTGAHRFAYEFCVGPIPEGLTIDHLCRVRHCVRPDHLEPVTHRDNILRGNGPPAINYRKTTCLKGHPLSGENLYLTRTGRRHCKLCQTKRTRAFRSRPELRSVGTLR